MLQFSVNFFQNEEQARYRLLAYSREEFKNDWKEIEHIHPHTEILFVTGGQGWLRSNGTEVKLEKGTLIVVTPFSSHTEISSSSSPLSFAAFSVQNITFILDNSKTASIESKLNEEYQKINEQENQQIFFFDFSAYFNELFHILAYIEREESERKPFWRTAFLSEFDKFIVFISRHMPLISLPHKSDSNPNILSSVHLYLRSQYTDDITLEKLSDYFFLSKYYLSHAFKEKYGISPMLFLNKCRCENAHKLLITTSHSIAQIAISVGFNSIIHFSRTYKKFYNVSPTQTRRTARLSENK
jgi:AraC-like DNA-binding protein